MTDPAAAAGAAERAARGSYGRLLALLAAPTGDVALAEDALAGAFEQALTTWPRTGVPRNPDGWLLTVVWRAATNTSDLAVLNATDIASGPVALVHLGHRVPDGFHGNWVGA